MPLFCEKCENLLSVITTASKFYFYCISCAQSYPHKEVDTLCLEQIKGTNVSISKTILQHANEDPVGPKIFKKCHKCNYHIVRQVRLDEDMRLINACVKCNEQWLETGN